MQPAKSRGTESRAMAPARTLQKPSINPLAEMDRPAGRGCQENDCSTQEARFLPRHGFPAFKVFHGSAIGAAIRPGAGKDLSALVVSNVSLPLSLMPGSR